MKSIFVSSTFKDMQAERNLIHFKVTPEINDFLKDYEEIIEFTDLRWGIDTTQYLNTFPEKVQEGEEKVLRICLEEIQKTPYFIAILGERYGWIPENKDIIDHVIEVLNKENQIEYTLNNKDISVTHLEIDYGAFFRKHPENCLFYFRELKQEKKSFFNFGINKKDNIYFAQDQEEKDRMNALKTRIEQEFPGRTRTYYATLDKETNEVINLDDFANMLINDVKEIIQKDLKKFETKFWQEKEEKEIKYIISRKAEKFSSQETILNHIDDFINDDNFEKDILFITGEAGTGKSTISSRIFQLYEDCNDVIPFFIDNTENSKDARDILKYNLYQLYKKIDINKNLLKRYLNNADTLLEFIYHEETNQIIGAKVLEYKKGQAITNEILRQNLDYNLDIYSKISNKNLIFIVDAIDQMQLENDEKEYKWIAKKNYKNVKYIITALNESYFAKNPLERMKQIELKELTKEDVINILKYNNKLSAKELTEEVIQKLSEKQEITNFLYLTFVLQRFKMFSKYDYDLIKKLGNDMTAINNHMLNIVKYLPSKLEYLCINVLEYTNDIYNIVYFRDILALIANTRYGLKEKDIQAIFEMYGLKWNSIEFKTILNFLDNYFIVREDDRIDFSHRIIREIIKDNYKDKTFADTGLKFNDIIIFYLIDLTRNDMLYVSDLIFHLWKEKISYTAIIEVIISIAKNDNENNKRILAKELWKYFRVTPEWLFEMQEYILKNKMEYDKTLKVGELDVIYDIDKFDFVEYFIFLIENFGEYINDNAYNKKIYLDLLKLWEKGILEENKNPKIKEEEMLFLEVIWETIASATDDSEEALKYFEKLIKNNNTDYILDAIRKVKKENSSWFEKRLQWIDELLQKEEIKNNNELYEELIKAKADTYFFLDNVCKYLEIMVKLEEKYKVRMNAENRTFEDCKKYLEIANKTYTIPGKNSMDIVNIEKLIDISKEILQWSKVQYKEKRDEKSKMQLAQSYELVARQYNVFGNYENNTILYPYDVKESNKYIKCIIKLLSDYAKYGDYLTEIIDYEIEMLEMDERRENKKTGQNDLERLIIKAIKTLKFEDICEYFEHLPIVEPIYEVAGYDNIDQLIQIYTKAKEFIKEYIDFSLYNTENQMKLEEKIRYIIEAYNCLSLVKFGLDEKYISEIVNMLLPYDDEIGKIFSYKAYQYFNEKTFIRRKKIIEELEKFTEGKEKKFQRDNKLDNIKSLYNIKRKMYINMIKNDTLEKYEDEENVTEGNEILAMKGYLWALIVKDDIHLSNNIIRTYSTLVNVLKDRKACIEIDKQRYDQKKKKDILEEIYKSQEYLIQDGYSISSQINEKSWYEYVLKDLEEIIEYQKNMNYQERILEYERKSEEYKKIIQEME